MYHFWSSSNIALVGNVATTNSKIKRDWPIHTAGERDVVVADAILHYCLASSCAVVVVVGVMVVPILAIVDDDW